MVRKQKPDVEKWGAPEAESVTETAAVATLPDEPRITAADILNPKREYCAADLERLLGVPVDVSTAAHNAGKFVQYRGTHPPYWLGSRILAWIEADRIQATPTDAGRRLYESLHPAESTEVKPPTPKPTLVDQAVAKAAACREDEAAQHASFVARLWRDYLEILQKPEGKVTDADAEQLASIMATLNLSRADVDADRKLIGSVKYWEDRHQRLPELDAKRIAALEAFHAMRKRYEEELAEAERQKVNAANEHAQAGQAAHELLMLSRRRPQLFKADTNPPQLLTTADE